MMSPSLNYNVLTENDLERIHEASLKLLVEKGVVFESKEALELFKKHGARVEGCTVFIPENLVNESLAHVPGNFKLCAINEKRSVTIGEGLIIHPAGGEVFIDDYELGRREATIKDFGNLQKVYQACENINLTGYQPLDPVDVPNRLKGLYCTLETMLYTDKPWLAPMAFVGRAEKNEILELYARVFGHEFMQNNYVTWNVVSPQSPLIYPEISCEGIISFAQQNQPITLVSAPMSGITSPINMMGSILLQNTETLAGICLAQLVRPGIPILPSASLTFGNLKVATWECGSPASVLMISGAVQMYRDFYKLPTRAQTGVTSSKSIDYQAGFETMQSLLVNCLSGVNVTSQSAGSLENLMTTSIEKTVIDDEIIFRVRQILKGIPTDDESLGLQAIMDIEHGKDYFAHESTLKHFRESWYPEISDWNLFDKWSVDKNKEIVKRAHLKVEEVLKASEKPILDLKIKKELDSYIEKIKLSL